MKIYGKIFTMNKKPALIYTESILFASDYLSNVCREYVRKIIKDNKFKLSFEEYLILEIIAKNPGMIQMDIAKKIFMQRSYLSKILAKLEDNGFIRRENAIKGKRQVVMSVFSTEFGENAYKEMHNSLKSQVLNKSMINYDKMSEITSELLEMANKLVETYNLKL